MNRKEVATRLLKQHSGKLTTCQSSREDVALHENALLISVSASYRLVWGLVHSSNHQDVDRGLRFADELLRDKALDAQDQRDLVYLTAVAMYKLGKVCTIALHGGDGSRPCLTMKYLGTRWAIGLGRHDSGQIH